MFHRNINYSHTAKLPLLIYTQLILYSLKNTHWVIIFLERKPEWECMSTLFYSVLPPATQRGQLTSAPPCQQLTFYWNVPCVSGNRIHQKRPHYCAVTGDCSTIEWRKQTVLLGHWQLKSLLPLVSPVQHPKMAENFSDGKQSKPYPTAVQYVLLKSQPSAKVLHEWSPHENVPDLPPCCLCAGPGTQRLTAHWPAGDGPGTDRQTDRRTDSWQRVCTKHRNSNIRLAAYAMNTAAKRCSPCHTTNILKSCADDICANVAFVFWSESAPLSTASMKTKCCGVRRGPWASLPPYFVGYCWPAKWMVDLGVVTSAMSTKKTGYQLGIMRRIDLLLPCEYNKHKTENNIRKQGGKSFAKYDLFFLYKKVKWLKELQRRYSVCAVQNEPFERFQGESRRPAPGSLGRSEQSSSSG